MFVSATGTLVASFVAGASPNRRNHSATLSVLMASVHTMKLNAFGALGVGVAAYTPLIVAMIATAVLGSWADLKLLNRMSEKLFRIIFQVLITGLAVRLLWVGAVETGIF